MSGLSNRIERGHGHIVGAALLGFALPLVACEGTQRYPDLSSTPDATAGVTARNEPAPMPGEVGSSGGPTSADAATTATPASPASATPASNTGPSSSGQPAAPVSGVASLSVTAGGDGFGEITLIAAGGAAQTCPPNCELEAPAGTNVTAAAAPRPYSMFFGWNDPACGGQLTCSVTVQGGAVLQANFRLAHNVAFTSSQVYAVGELPRPGAAANAECARLAAQAGVHGTRWVAWLASEGPTSSPVDDITPGQSLQSAGGWVRRDGAPLARSRSALLAGELLHPINLTELGMATSVAAWSAASLDGALNRSLGPVAPDCNGWTAAEDAGLFAALAESGAVGGAWTGRSIASCGVSGALQCFGDDDAPELNIIGASGRLAFVSVSEFLPGGGIQAADDLCQREACEAGLTQSRDACQTDPGTRRFLSYLHSSQGPAWQRFDLDAPGWVRPDGISWLSPASLLAGDAVGRSTGLNVTARQSYQIDRTPAWLGRATGEDSCADWTLNTGQALVAETGDAVLGTPLAGEFPRTSDCSAGARVFCLQE